MKRPVLFAALAACAPHAPPPEPTAAPSRPKLVVYVVVDQFPVRELAAIRPLATGGFARLTGRDAFVATARYPYAITFTCPGHATLSTGAAPSVSGIPANNWFLDGKDVYCADISLLRAEPLADRVAAAGGHVAALSLKDRAAIMLGGHHADLEAWYDGDKVAFVGPGSEQLGIDVHAYLEQPWTALHPEAYAATCPDDQPFEGDPGGFGRTFPHPALAVAGPQRLRASPFGGTALTDAAIAAVDRLGLGADDVPDLLAVSYSQTDYVGHAYGAESWEAMDTALRLDADLDRLFGHLDASVGAGAWTVVLTSDHGSDPLPPKTRIPVGAVETAANGALARAGFGGQVLWQDPSIWLPADLRADPARRATAATAVAEAVEKVDGIGHAYAWRDGGLPDDAPYAKAVRLSLDDERSGDVYVLIGEGSLFAYPDSTGGTSHGTPYPYDQEVPLLAWGAGIHRGTLDEEPDSRRIAPTVAALLGVPAPAQATEPPISQALASPP